MPVLQFFTVKMSDGVVATSYKAGDKFYIDPMKLLPLDRFLPRPKGAPSPGGRGGECVRIRLCTCRAVRGRLRHLHGQARAHAYITHACMAAGGPPAVQAPAVRWALFDEAVTPAQLRGLERHR